MTDERDDYMRRQAMDHDMIAMREPRYVQQFGRALRPVPVADMKHVTFAHGEFTLPAVAPDRTPGEKILLLLANAGVATSKIDHVMPAIHNIIAAVERRAFYAGVREAQSRAANKPGDGDMGA